MKTLSYKFWYILMIGLVVSFSGCQEVDDLVTSTALSGGVVETQNKVVNYQIGDPTAEYTVTLLIPQGDVKTEAIEVWATFTNALGTGEAGLLATILVSNTQNSDFESASFNYGDLRVATRQADGSELPEDDFNLVIGDFWTVSYKSITTAGAFTNAALQNTTVGVATRFAGTYAVKEKAYYRIGVHRDDLDSQWPNTIDYVSIDATMYKQLEWAGLFDGNELFFIIDGDLVITYPVDKPNGDPQILNDQPIITCESNPADMVNVNCGEPTTNTAVKVDPSQMDIFYMAFGYYTDGSGPREFYQKMEKVVE